MLKQNAMVLVEVADNYEILLLKKNSAKKEEIPGIDLQIKNFRKQFLYLLSAIDRAVREEKNAR